MKAAYVSAVIIIIVIAAFFFLSQSKQQQETYSVSPEGIVTYTNRLSAQFRVVSESMEGDTIVKRVEFESRGGAISGVLRIPKSTVALPAFVILPGATVPAGTNLEQDLNKLGFITLGLDQRGVGQTKAQPASIQEDFVAFLNSNEPAHHKMFYDALRAVDILEGLPEVNKDKIYTGGESMGARFAIMAAAVEPSVKGVLAISTSGFGFEQMQDRGQREFVRSIDPDNYITKLAGRPVIFIHGDEDPVIPIAMGRALFEKAQGPKEFMEVKAKGHGYGPQEMFPVISQKLEGWK